MKKIFIVSLILVLVCFVSILPVLSADTDFVIEDGVLIAYNGSEESVTIPSTVNSISDKAFYNNTAVKTLKLNNNVYSIGNEAFYGCTSLTTVSGGDNVKYVGAFAFSDTKFLTLSTDEFLTVGSALISYNGKSEKVTLPDTVKSVSPYAFLRNKSITSFIAGDELTSIGEGTFFECSSLKNINVGEYLSFVGADAFSGTAWLSAQGEFAVIGDGVLVAYKGTSSIVNIPIEVRSIAPNAFYENKSIVTLNLPPSVFSIGARAFMSCSNLKEISLNNGLVMIDDEAFANCNKLSAVETPVTLSKIGKGAFINCSSISHAFIRGNNLSLDYGAFAYCTSMKSVTLSKDVSAVSGYAFAENVELKCVSVPPSVISITPDCFSGASPTIVCDTDSVAFTVLSSQNLISHNRGDCDNDGDLSILDATGIQLHLADMKKLDVKNFPYADADFDGSISVLDATYVQKLLAGLL